MSSREEMVKFLVQEHAAAILAAREAERAYQDALDRAEFIASIKFALYDDESRDREDWLADPKTEICP